MTSLNALENYRSELLAFVTEKCDSIRKNREKKGYISTKWFIANIREAILASGCIPNDFPFDAFEAEFIERAGFSADIAFKSTRLLSEDKGKYFKELAPALVGYFSSAKKADGASLFAEVKSVGIYVNVRLSDVSFFEPLFEVQNQGKRYGENANGKGQDIVVDYSSPNAAKHLHAGHIRSTIIGHVLGNLYEASGYAVHRVNYLNDWGGMGFLMEGVLSRKDAEKYANKNDFLASVYSAFRTAQKASDKEEEFVKLSDVDKENIKNTIGNFESYADLKAAFADFVARSNARFSLLENGDNEAYNLWRTIVEWSLADFERFYDILRIHQDYLTGESLYAQSGKDLVMTEAQKNDAVFFDEKEAEKAISHLEIELASGNITEEIFARKKEEILSDIGCYVVLLDKGERFVALKKDGSTIYATRDLAALEHRSRVFNPEKILYEVGQEQQEHFDKLFRAAKALGIIPHTEPIHIYHGFYVDEASKKKLSSRDGASNILKLLTDTVAYFRAKYDDSEEFSESEKDHIARVLGVGSVVFNDVKRDKKSSVSISADFEKMMLQFEESGGAYLIYASCRAKSMIRKYGKALPDISSIVTKEFLPIEIDLMKKILVFPEVVYKAAISNDPVKISEHIMNLALAFNSYYNSTPILKGDSVEQRLAIASCVSQVIDNGLSLLHVESLERI